MQIESEICQVQGFFRNRSETAIHTDVNQERACHIVGLGSRGSRI